jgi:hypothetical protein
MCGPASDLNSDINGAGRNVYMVSRRSDWSNAHSYSKYYNYIYGNLFGCRLPFCNRKRNSNR